MDDTSQISKLGQQVIATASSASANLGCAILPLKAPIRTVDNHTPGLMSLLQAGQSDKARDYDWCVGPAFTLQPVKLYWPSSLSVVRAA